MSDDNMLSQEEIDALMNKKQDSDDDKVNEISDDPFENLNEEEKDVIGEVNNIAMGSAATALYTILDRKVEITTPQVELIKFKDITKEYDRPCVLVKVEYVEGLEGVNLLIIQKKDAAIIADLMMGGDGTDPDQELSEMHTSAVGEAMNQMMGSASTALSSIIDGVVNISPPNARYLDLNDAVDEDEDLFDPDEELVATSFNLKIGDLVDSTFKQLAPKDFTKKLVATLTGKDSRGLTAKEDNIQQEEISAVAEEKSQEAEKSTVSQQQAQPQQSQQQPQQSQQQQQQQKRQQPAAQQPQQGAAAASTGNRRVQREEEVAVQSAQFPDFDEDSAQPLPQNMELIKDVPLQVTVRLGKAKMKIKDILELGEGSIVELDKLAGEPVDLLVNGKLVAKGEVVVIDENFGFRVKDIISPMERINNI
ncbi:MAG: flagellar motor switch phosphatase FliY [Bacillota bacterium]